MLLANRSLKYNPGTVQKRFGWRPKHGARTKKKLGTRMPPLSHIFVPDKRDTGWETPGVYPWPPEPESIHHTDDPHAVSSDWLTSKAYNDGSGARVNNVMNFNWKFQNAFDLTALREFKGHLGRIDQSDFNVVAVFNAPEGMDFCPGADLVKLAQRGVDYNRQFYKEQQETCYYTATMRTPAFACMQGKTFGLGAGLTAHTSFRLFTESAIWCMPNVLYGSIPDCGMTFRLPRLEGEIGMFLALTGKRVESFDIPRIGLASHHMTSSNLRRFCQETGKIVGTDENATETFFIMMNRWLDAMPGPDEPSAIIPHIPSIERCFSPRHLQDVFTRLDEENTFWSRNTLERLRTQCPPLILHVIFRLQKMGRYLESVAECLELEYRVMNHVLQSHDYWEGLKAHMIEKRAPVWQHKRIEDVTEEEISTFFEPVEHCLDLKGCEMGNQPASDPFSTYNMHVRAEMEHPFRQHFLDRELNRLIPPNRRSLSNLTEVYRSLFKEGGMAHLGGSYYHQMKLWHQTLPDRYAHMDPNGVKDPTLQGLIHMDNVQEPNQRPHEYVPPGMYWPYHHKDKL